MKTMSKVALALLGIAGVALVAETAQAQLVLNGAGSSAGRLFAGDSPAALCATTPKPLLFVSSESTPNMYEWQCTITVGANSYPGSTIRYSASKSADGYNFQPLGSIGTANYLNVGGSPGCAVGSDVVIEGVTVSKSVCPSNQATQPLTVHWGGADVKAASLHQTGWDGTQISTFIPPIAGHLKTLPTVIVPFAIVVGGNVRGVDPNTLLPVTLLTMTEEQVRQIFSGAVTDWTQLGYTTSAGSTAIVTCQRTIGSGTLATLDETIMRPVFWSGGVNTDTTANNPNNIWNASSGNMVSCLNSNQNSIGYLDSDSVTALNFPNGAYQVAINGQTINSGPGNGIGTGKARLTSLRCGRYPYWEDWNFIKRTAGVEVAPISAPVGTNNAITQLQTLMKSHNPLPDYWLSEGDSFVSKNADRGPFVWNSPTTNGDTIAAVCTGTGSVQ